MKRLVFVTQQADPEHPVLGATAAQIRALAERVDEVLVLANGDAVEGALPPNCRVRSFGAPTKAARTARDRPSSMVNRSRVQSTDTPRRFIWATIRPWYSSFHCQPRSTNFSRPIACQLTPSRSNCWRSSQLVGSAA